MAKTITAVFIAVMLLFAAYTVLADDNVRVFTDSVCVEFDEGTGIPYVSDNNKTMVPLRKSMESFGAEVAWNETSNSAVLTKDGMSVTVTVGKKEIVTGNGKKITIEEAPIETGGRIFLPIRDVAENLGAYVLWNNDTNTVYIMSDKYTTFRDSFTYKGEISKYAEKVISVSAYYNGEMNEDEFCRYWKSYDNTDKEEFLRVVAADKKFINPEYDVFINFWYDNDKSPLCLATVTSITYEPIIYNPFEQAEIKSLNQ